MNTRFVAEICSNHGQDLDRCLRFVDVSAEIGCDTVKFQQFRVRELFSPEALRAKPALLERERWELPEAFNASLARRAHERGIRFASTPFYIDAVEVLEPWVDFYKVASHQLLWHELLHEVGRTRKPVVLATGMATLEETGKAVDILRAAGCAQLTLLHCVSLYPTEAEEANLAAIETLRRTFGCEVGWSDHTVEPDVVRRAALRWGADMVEFHLDLEGMGEEYGGGHCWLPDEICRVLLDVRRGPELPEHSVMDGDGRKAPLAAESHERAWRTDPADGLRPLLATRREFLGDAA